MQTLETRLVMCILRVKDWVFNSLDSFRRAKVLGKYETLNRRRIVTNMLNYILCAIQQKNHIVCLSCSISMPKDCILMYRTAIYLAKSNVIVTCGMTRIQYQFALIRTNIFHIFPSVQSSCAFCIKSYFCEN